MTPAARLSIRSALKAARFFSALPDAAIERLAEAPSIIRTERGAPVFFRGEASDAAYLVLGGEIAIEIASEDGRRVRIDTMKSGDVFGELALLDGGERSADARSVSEGTLLRIESGPFADLVAAHPQFALAIIRDLARKIRATDALVASYITDSLQTRLANYLLAQAQVAGGAGAAIRITQNELADRLIASREKVNRCLGDLEKEGAIVRKRGQIVIADIRKLGLAREMSADENRGD